jgi:hypothetical protein
LNHSRSATAGLGLLTPLFGEDLTASVHTLSRLTGLPTRDALALLALVASLVVAVVDRVRRQAWLACDEFRRMLATQRYHRASVASLARGLADPRSSQHLAPDHLGWLAEDLLEAGR